MSVTARLRAGHMVRADLDHARGVMRLYRLDTGADVGTRPLTDSERQGRLL